MAIKHNKARFIVVWFGELPDYFNIFLKSCKYNSYFEWVVLTDQDTTKYNPPKNVLFKSITPQHFLKLARKRLGSTVQTLDTDPRKITDFKPFYSILFPELVKNYKYYGHCDIDIIWGDMSIIIDMCDIYHIISSRRAAASGHLMLFHHDSKVIESLAKNKYNIKYVDEALSSDKFIRLDEAGFTNHVTRHQCDTGEEIFWDWGLCNFTRKEIYERVPRDWLLSKKNNDHGNGYSDYPWSDKTGCWRWSKGKLYTPNEKEIAYLHYLTCKQDVEMRGCVDKSEEMYICIKDNTSMYIDFK